jgi:hypothetical protein
MLKSMAGLGFLGPMVEGAVEEKKKRVAAKKEREKAQETKTVD